MSRRAALEAPERPRRAVVTGIGVVAPNGVGADAWWAATLARSSGIREITRFPADGYAARLAGEVDFEPRDWAEQRLLVQTDRWTWMAFAAAALAFEDAGIDPGAEPDPYAIGVVTSNSSGGNEFGQRQIQSLWAKGPRFVGAYQSIAWFYAAATGQLSIRNGLKGPNGVVCAEEAGGLEALAQARRSVARGTDVVLAGGLEAPIGPYALTCALQSGALTTSLDPVRAYRPFADDADGHVIGEGGALLVVEELEHARARGAGIYAELAGYGATHDGVDFDAGGAGLARAMRLAVERSGTAAGDVDLLIADAHGTRLADRAEALAIRGTLPAGVPVAAPKAYSGRLAGGGAPLDVAAGLLALRDQIVPPSPVVRQDPALALELAPVPRPARIRTVLVAARGYGGFNAALMLKALEAQVLDQPAREGSRADADRDS